MQVGRIMVKYLAILSSQFLNPSPDFSIRARPLDRRMLSERDDDFREGI